MASVQIPPPIDGVRDSSSTPPAVTLAAPRASTLSGQPNEVESRLLDEVHRVVIDILADRLVVDCVVEPTVGTHRQLSEEKSGGGKPPSSPSSSLSSSALRLDVLLSRFLYLNREALLEEIRARKDDASRPGGGGGKGAGSGKRRAAGRRRRTEQGRTTKGSSSGRSRKKTKEDENAEDDVASKPRRTRKQRQGKDGEADEGASKPKRKRGLRPEKAEEVDVPKPKRKRGCPKKDEGMQRAEAISKAKAEAKARAEAKVMAELERKEERERKREEHKRKLQEESDRKFDEMFEELIRFKKEHGHANVPQKGHGRLSKWVNVQRQHYKWLRDEYDGTRDTPPVPGCRVKKSALTAERIQRLTDIGFQFRVKTGRKNYTFEERLEQLAAAKAQLDLGGSAGEGDSGGGTFGIDDIPKGREEWVARIGGELDASIGSGDGDDPYQGLRSWLVVRIDAHHKLVAGKKPNIPFTHEQAKRISDLGFVLPAEFLRKQSWEKRFQELLAYYREHGDCLVKKAYPGGLGEWVIQQRKRYKALLAEQCGGDEEVLFAMDERTRRLKEAGFVFSCRVRRWRKKPVEEGPGE